jgi:hypothetical protein
MISKLLITISIIFYALVVPYLEINSTHVFSPDWIAHAKIHEVWQLITNSSLGILALWFIWKEDKIKTGALLGILVMGGFLVAYAIQDLYGGSMKYPDGTEKMILGMNLGVFGFGLGVILSLLGILFKGFKSK